MDQKDLIINLARRNNFDLERALNDGHSYEDILAYLQEESGVTGERPEGDPGFIGGVKDFGLGIARGALVSLPQKVGQTFQRWDDEGGDDTLRDLGISLEETGDENLQEQPWLQESRLSIEKRQESPWNIRGWGYSAGDSLITSLAPAAVGAAAVVAGAPAAVGVGIGVVTVGALFYGSEAEQTYRRALPELGHEEALELSRLTGLIEAGGEIVADLIPLWFFKALPSPARKNILKALTSKKGVRGIIWDIIKVEALEVSTEIGQSTAQGLAEERFGMGDQPLLDNALAVIGPTLIVGGLYGTAGSVGGNARRSWMVETLKDPKAPIEDKRKIIAEITEAVTKKDAELGAAFSKQATALAEAKKPVLIGEDSKYESKKETKQESKKEREIVSKPEAEIERETDVQRGALDTNFIADPNDSLQVQNQKRIRGIVGPEAKGSTTFEDTLSDGSERPGVTPSQFNKGLSEEVLKNHFEAVGKQKEGEASRNQSMLIKRFNYTLNRFKQLVKYKDTYAYSLQEIGDQYEQALQSTNLRDLSSTRDLFTRLQSQEQKITEVDQQLIKAAEDLLSLGGETKSVDQQTLARIQKEINPETLKQQAERRQQLINDAQERGNKVLQEAEYKNSPEYAKEVDKERQQQEADQIKKRQAETKQAAEAKKKKDEHTKAIDDLYEKTKKRLSESPVFLRNEDLSKQILNAIHTERLGAAEIERVIRQAELNRLEESGTLQSITEMIEDKQSPGKKDKGAIARGVVQQDKDKAQAAKTRAADKKTQEKADEVTEQERLGAAAIKRRDLKGRLKDKYGTKRQRKKDVEAAVKEKQEQDQKVEELGDEKGSTPKKPKKKQTPPPKKKSALRVKLDDKKKKKEEPKPKPPKKKKATPVEKKVVTPRVTPPKKKTVTDAAKKEAAAEKKREAAAKKYQANKKKREADVDENNRLVQKGKELIPTIRLEDAREVGEMGELLEKGEITPDEWDSFVERMFKENRAKGKINEALGDPKRKKAPPKDPHAKLFNKKKTIEVSGHTFTAPKYNSTQGEWYTETEGRRFVLRKSPPEDAIARQWFVREFDSNNPSTTRGEQLVPDNTKKASLQFVVDEYLTDKPKDPTEGGNTPKGKRPIKDVKTILKKKKDLPDKDNRFKKTTKEENSTAEGQKGMFDIAQATGPLRGMVAAIEKAGGISPVSLKEIDNISSEKELDDLRETLRVAYNKSLKKPESKPSKKKRKKDERTSEEILLNKGIAALNKVGKAQKEELLGKVDAEIKLLETSDVYYEKELVISLDNSPTSFTFYRENFYKKTNKDGSKETVKVTMLDALKEFKKKLTATSFNADSPYKKPPVQNTTSVTAHIEKRAYKKKTQKPIPPKGKYIQPIYQDGFYSNRQYLVKMDDAPSVGKLPYATGKINMESILSTTGLEEVTLGKEYLDTRLIHDPESPIAAHDAESVIHVEFEDGDLKHYIYKTTYINAILTEHPKATPKLHPPTGMLKFFDGSEEIVGITMPVGNNLKVGSTTGLIPAIKEELGIDPTDPAHMAEFDRMRATEFKLNKIYKKTGVRYLAGLPRGTWYDPAGKEIIGKQISELTNLSHAEVEGIESLGKLSMKLGGRSDKYSPLQVAEALYNAGMSGNKGFARIPRKKRTFITNGDDVFEIRDSGWGNPLVFPVVSAGHFTLSDEQILSIQTEYKEKDQQTFTIPDNPDVSFTTGQKTNQNPISETQIKQAFKGQSVILTGKKTYSVRFQNGRGATIKIVDQTPEGSVLIEAKGGVLNRNGQLIAGKQYGTTIELVEGVATEDVLTHEIQHLLERIGVVTPADVKVLDKAVIRASKRNKLAYELHSDPRENRAYFIQQLIRERKDGRGTVTGRVVQKIKDFFSKLAKSIFGIESASNIARELESGEIFKREAIKQQELPISTEQPLYSTVNGFDHLKIKSTATKAIRNTNMGKKSLWDNIKDTKDFILGDIKGNAKRGKNHFVEQYLDRYKYLKTVVGEHLDEIGVKLSPEEDPYKARRMIAALPQIMGGVFHDGLILEENGWVAYKKEQDPEEGELRGGVLSVFEALGDSAPAFKLHYLANSAQFLFDNKEVSIGKKLFGVDPETPEIFSDSAGKMVPNYLDTQTVIDELREATKEEWDANKDLWKSAEDRLQEINDSVLQFAVDTGVIKASSVPQWKREFYLPFNRMAEDFLGDAYKSIIPRSKGNTVGGIKHLKGSKMSIGDPIENLLTNYTYIVNEGIKNQANTKLYKALEKAKIKNDQGQEVSVFEVRKVGKPENIRVRAGEVNRGLNSLLTSMGFDPSKLPKGTRDFYVDMVNMVSPINEDGVFSIKEKGVSKFIKTNDPHLFEVLADVNNEAITASFIKMLSAPKRLLTLGITVNPAFRIANLLRDVIHSKIISPNFKISGVAKALRDVWNEHPEYLEMRGIGGAFSGGWHTQDAGKTIDSVINKGKGDKGKGVLLSMWDAWEKVGEAAENASRLALYRENLADGKSKFASAFESRDLMDFSNRGRGALAQHLIALVPFLNAHAQGQYKFARAISEEETQEHVINTGLLLTVLASTLLAINRTGNEDEWEELETHEKWQYLHFFGTEKHYRVPLPFEVGLLFGTVIPATLDMVLDAKDEPLGEAIWDYTKFLGQASFGISLVPQAFKPAAEVYNNKNYFTGRPIVNPSMERKDEVDHYDQYTSDTSRIVAKAIEGLSEVSPKNIDHLVNGYFGFAGRFGLLALDGILKPFSDFPVEPAARSEHHWLTGVILGSGRFRRDKNPKHTKYETAYYELVNEVDQVINSLNGYKSSRDYETYKKYMSEHREEYLNHNKLKLFTKQIRKLNTRRKIIAKNQKLSPAERRKQLDEVFKKRTEVFKQALERIR